MFKGDSMYSILPIDATYFFNITIFKKYSHLCKESLNAVDRLEFHNAILV